jgi:hypothetical protein
MRIPGFAFGAPDLPNIDWVREEYTPQIPVPPVYKAGTGY